MQPTHLRQLAARLSRFEVGILLAESGSSVRVVIGPLTKDGCIALAADSGEARLMTQGRCALLCPRHQENLLLHGRVVSVPTEPLEPRPRTLAAWRKDMTLPWAAHVPVRFLVNASEYVNERPSPLPLRTRLGAMRALARRVLFAPLRARTLPKLPRADRTPSC